MSHVSLFLQKKEKEIEKEEGGRMIKKTKDALKI
jgi:hypothetical protein